MNEALSWADEMRRLAPRVVRNLKEILYRGYSQTTEQGNAFAQALEQNIIGMEDYAEGAAAFVEKRQPHFKNR